MDKNSLVYVINAKNREVIIGRRTDMVTFGCDEVDYTYCTSEEELYKKVSQYREQEWILTSVSPLPVFRQLCVRGNELTKEREEA